MISWLSRRFLVDTFRGNHFPDRHSGYSQNAGALPANQYLFPNADEPFRLKMPPSQICAGWAFPTLPFVSSMSCATNKLDACPNCPWLSLRPMWFSSPRWPPVPSTAPNVSPRTCERNLPSHRMKRLLAGQRILLGLFKKFVIADTLALIALNDAACHPSPHDRLDVDHRVRLRISDLLRLQRLHRYCHRHCPPGWASNSLKTLPRPISSPTLPSSGTAGT